MSKESQARIQHLQPDSKEIEGQDSQEVQATVNYLPATEPFHKVYPSDALVETVRVDAMQFFGVRDRQERDTFRYFLEFDKERVNTSQTLDQLLGPHRRGAQFNLIEEITPGALAEE